MIPKELLASQKSVFHNTFIVFLETPKLLRTSNSITMVSFEAPSQKKFGLLTYVVTSNIPNIPMKVT